MPTTRRSLALAFPALAGAARAQNAWSPSAPVRVIIPFTAGGAMDPVVRLAQAALQADLGQPVVMDYRPGGATVVGQAVSQGSALLALSDGRVLGMPGADDPSGSTELSFGRSNPTAGQVTAVAVSPDGQQALVVYQDPLLGGLLTVVTFKTKDWKPTSQLTLPATGTPRALSYDRAGSQATLLFATSADLPDGGQAPATGYCTLH